MVTKVEKVIYKAHATSTGGRDGKTRSSDGLLDVKLSVPREMGGAGGGVNPEQLFAAGYSACFIGAMKFVAGTQKIALPAETSINATVGIGQIPAGFGIEVQLEVTVPGMDRASFLTEAARRLFPDKDDAEILNLVRYVLSR